jgi:hypothetical protein
VSRRRLLFCIHVDVMLISPIPCLFVLLRVDEPVAEDPGVQQIEVAEQELIEGKMCPWLLLFTQ